MTLEDRVAKLEAKLLQAETEPLYIVRVFVEPGEAVPAKAPEFVRLDCNGQSWSRLDGESEDEFKARAIREVERPKGPLVFAVNRPVARLLQAP